MCIRDSITATAEGPKHFDMTLTRAKFDELTHDLVERTAIPVQNAMKAVSYTHLENKSFYDSRTQKRQWKNNDNLRFTAAIKG